MKRLAVVAALLLIARVSHAVPLLQIDLSDGTYVGGTEQSTITTKQTFTVFALLTPGEDADAQEIAAFLEQEFKLSIAIMPKTGPADADLGSFTIDGPGVTDNEISATDEMVYGTPPLEEMLQTFDPGDLGKHGVFETFFYEVSFKFDENVQILPYDVANDGGTDPSGHPGTGTFVVAFEIDVSNLVLGTSLHFDLYSTTTKANGDVDRVDFAPFSHDAAVLPEPATLALTAFGSLLVGVGALRRRKK